MYLCTSISYIHDILCLKGSIGLFSILIINRFVKLPRDLDFEAS